jgi:hypothetical protein
MSVRKGRHLVSRGGLAQEEVTAPSGCRCWSSDKLITRFIFQTGKKGKQGK